VWGPAATPGKGNQKDTKNGKDKGKAVESYSNAGWGRTEVLGVWEGWGSPLGHHAQASSSWVWGPAATPGKGNQKDAKNGKDKGKTVESDSNAEWGRAGWEPTTNFC